MPHGYCLAWNPQLLWLIVAGNGLIAIAYYSIPAALWIFLSKRKDLVFNWMFNLFAAFILCCGTTHVMKLWTIWHPNYWAEGCVDLLTGVLSALTAILLWPLIPKAIAIRGPKHWEEANKRLERALQEQYDTAQELRSSQRLTRAIIHSAGDAFVALDRNGVIADWNRQATNAFGWSHDEAVGQRLTDMIIPEEYREAYIDSLGDLTLNRQDHVTNRCLELNALCKDGHEVPIEITMFPVEVETTFRCCAFIRDISQRKEADRRVNEFYSIVSHELRTPLTSIRSALGLVSSGIIEPRSEEGMELLKIASDSTSRLVNLVNDILDLKKIEAGKMVLNKSVVNVEELISATLQTLGGIAANADITLMHTANMLENVHADWDKATQILMNLVSNALKFSPPGSQVSVVTKPGSEGRIRICVIDNGCGIAKENMQKLFAKFQQIDSSDTRQKGGTGLGLAISKALVEEHGGIIGVESTMGQGSNFWFELPLYAD